MDSKDFQNLLRSIQESVNDPFSRHDSIVNAISTAHANLLYSGNKAKKKEVHSYLMNHPNGPFKDMEGAIQALRNSKHIEDNNDLESHDEHGIYGGSRSDNRAYGDVSQMPGKYEELQMSMEDDYADTLHNHAKQLHTGR